MDDFKERQKRENNEAYLKWLSCGFKGEMKLDETGWFNEGKCLEGKKRVIYEKGWKVKATVETMQLPNNRWIGGSHLLCNSYGYGFGLSIWNKQYETEAEAVEAQLQELERRIKDNDRKMFSKGITAYRNEFKQDTLIVSTERESYEQGTLF